MSRKSAALIYGLEIHHLDHLAVICKLLDIPLIVTEEKIANLAREYYPHLEIKYYEYTIVAESTVKDYDVIFTCLPKALFEEIFFFAQRFLHKKLHTVWVPHGNSDKGHLVPFMEGLNKEEIALVYGQKMIDFLKQKGVLNQLLAHVVIGNLRYTFYLREKKFFEITAAREISLPETGTTFLYAPTWMDSEKSSSFFTACPAIINALADLDFLIIKPHPHLFEDPRTEEIIEKYENRKNVLFLKEFPPIFPLLDIVDVYIGDLSSIGYDFLAFNRPMFFLNETKRDAKTDQGLYLFRCGVEILPEQYKDIFKIINIHVPTDKQTFSKVRKEVYNYTFGEDKEWDTVREEILQSFDVLPDPELDFL